MKIVANDSLTVSNVNDGSITHTAWSYSADGTDRFTTVYPNLNLLEGTKDFSGNWDNSSAWVNDGTYKGLTVKKRTGQWKGINKTFTAPKDGVYTFSAYIKASGTTKTIIRHRIVNGVAKTDYLIDSNFDWRIDTVTVSLKTGQTALFRYEIYTNNADAILWNAGHKWEPGSVATPYMQSASEVTTADWPKYIGHYTDFTQADSTNPSDYTWGPMRGDDGIGITSTVITYANSTSGTTAPSTGWTSSIPSLVKGQYLWTKTVWTYTDTSTKTAYSVSYNSKDGTNGTDGTSGIIVSSVAPDSPQNGQLWQDTSTTPQLVKKWTGTSWVIWELYVENMNVNNLSALSPNLGNITGGSYTSWSVSMDPVGNPILNGIYMYDGRIRSVSITNPISTDPKKVGGIVNSIISGMEMFGGYTDYYRGEYAPVNGTADDMIKGLNGMSFWSQQNDTGAYVGRIVGFQLGDDDPYILISAPRLLVNGSIHAGGGVTTGSTWIKLSSLASYKVEFGRVTISVSATTGNSTASINVGNIPTNKRPSTDLMFNVPGWSIDTNLDRRCQVNKSDGKVTILRPAANTVYQFEISYALP